MWVCVGQRGVHFGANGLKKHEVKNEPIFRCTTILAAAVADGVTRFLRSQETAAYPVQAGVSCPACRGLRRKHTRIPGECRLAAEAPLPRPLGRADRGATPLGAQQLWNNYTARWLVSRVFIPSTN